MAMSASARSSDAARAWRVALLPLAQSGFIFQQASLTYRTTIIHCCKTGDPYSMKDAHDPCTVYNEKAQNNNNMKNAPRDGEAASDAPARL